MSGTYADAKRLVGSHARLRREQDPTKHCNLLVRLLVFLLITLTAGGCFRGQPSRKPPIHLNPNMDHQPKYEAQQKSEFFTDGATMRIPVLGTVARGELRDDDVYYTGKDKNGKFIKKIPLDVTLQLLQRGQERFNIYCAPCHSRIGDGQGIISKYGYVPPVTFHSDRIRQMPDGEIFNVITNGVRNMPSYRHQIPVSDRWAIISYVRALQRSQNATVDDVPIQMRKNLK